MSLSTDRAVPILPRYRPLELLGRGAMGEVWLAEDLELPRKVAIKVLPRHLAEDRAAVERLLREARTVARVDHPNIVAVYDAGVADGQPYLVMQRVEGATLEERLRHGPLAPAEAVSLGLALAGALAEVHALGIVHRDLKPSNIVLSPHGPRVLDFGVAAVDEGARATTTAAAVGTPLATSPEQFRGAEPDPRSDLWALGVVLYQALTGVHPFDGRSVAAVAHRVLNEEPEAPSRLAAGVPPALDRVVAGLLRKDPARRYARAEEVVGDLAALPDARRRHGPDGTEVPRLAVLPFETLGDDPDDALLASGLTEDLIVDLARIEGLRVAARGEVMAYRTRDVPARTIARELGADLLVQGSVRRAGRRARIGAQLVHAADGRIVWAERFDRTVDDLFDAQAEVSTRIAEALQVTLRPAERAMLGRAPTHDRAAYALYLRARALLDESRDDASQRAIQCLRQAVDLDPGFALAHAALAEALVVRATFWWAGLEVTGLARPHAERALAIEPDLPDAHLALALVHRLEGDAQGALDELDRTRRLDPADPRIAELAAKSLMALGRPLEAVALLEAASRARPESYSLWSALADCYDMLGRADDHRFAVARCRDALVETLQRQPDDVRARAILGIALVQTGEREAGIAQIERALADSPADGRVRYNAACAFAQAGNPERALAELREAVKGFPSYVTDWPRNDPDLASLRDQPEFIRMFGRA